jgi:UDP-N-acetylmuramate--alanine ligase
MQLEKIKKVYFVGIGGIGMSALARYFKSKGVEVVGSDRDLSSESVKNLIDEGFKVAEQSEIDKYSLQNLISGVDAVIYTLAIPPDNLELKYAFDQGIETFTYAEMLGLVSAEKFTVAIAGTHGKTSTTGMCAQISTNLGLSPNVIIGSFLKTADGRTTNFISGNSDLFIVEACEYKRSFLNLSPKILVITNIEADHLDYYKDLEDVKSAFYDLASKVPEDGKIICNKGDENLSEIVSDFEDKIVDYSEIISKVPEMGVFGDHNNQNAAAAISAIQNYIYLQRSDVEIESQEVIDAVSSFSGTWRRMEYKGQIAAGAKIYDDYGHHPTEISATLKSFKNHFKDKKLCVVFQPHLHSRTASFFDEFVEVLQLADRVIIYPIYKARAEDDHGVSAEILVEKIGESAEFDDSFESIASKISELDDEWIVILLGAGEVYQVADLLNFK